MNPAPPDLPLAKPRRRRILPFIGFGLAALLVAAGAIVWLFGTPERVETALGGPFTLTNGAGQTVTDASFRGKFMLVYFGYTFCPDVCPTTLNDVATALDTLGAKADRLQPLFVTVDPARDTPAVVQQYTAAFSPRIEGLTGTADQIRTIAAEYRVYYARHQTGPGPGDYTMDHSSILYVMRPDGRFAGILRADEPADALAADLAKYLS